MKIEELISSIRRREIVVPEFQREFVWNKSRARELIYSLLNEYPVGGILIWKTDEPPHLKGEEFKEDLKHKQICCCIFTRDNEQNERQYDNDGAGCETYKLLVDIFKFEKASHHNLLWVWHIRRNLYHLPRQRWKE